MKTFILFILIVILILICGLLKKKDGFTTTPSYKSVTTISNDYEIYSKDDKFYPSYKMSLSKKDIFIKLLKFGDAFFQEHKINYSIIYGTLLGFIRNKKFIPYDHDLDCIIGSESIPKLIKLGKDTDIKNVMFNDEIKKYKPDFKSDQIYVVLNKSLLNNNGYGTRFNCKGVSVQSQIDRCSFSGLFGRFILNNIEYDIFPYSDNFKNLIKKKNINEHYYPEKIKEMAKINNNDIIRDKLEDINISVLKESQSKQLLKFTYGENFMKPDKKYN